MASQDAVIRVNARPAWLRPALLILAILAIGIPTLLVRFGPTVTPTPRHRPVALPTRRVVPPAELPPVEPVAYVAVTPDDARAFNATVPFSTAPNPAARPFTFAGGGEDRARAVDCLAAGVLYEAGDDGTGERAVAQVILNRLRHPAFPKTVCGVVFQGSDRSTGCQFSFTCDGAMTRWRPSEVAWTRARAVATAALSGTVYRSVGYATHYHTDWVVPYWQSSLDKITKVGTHLFFRWTGWWGTPPAFDRHQSGGEPAVAALAALSPAHAAAAAAAAGAVDPAAVVNLPGGSAMPLAADPDVFLLALDPKVAADTWPRIALAACRDKARCIVMGWTDRGAMPAGIDMTAGQSDAMAFSYLRNREVGIERTLWNCAVHPRTAKNECMKRQLLQAEPVTPAPAANPTPTPGPQPLAGVRRRGDAPAPAAPPTPTARATPAAAPR